MTKLAIRRDRFEYIQREIQSIGFFRIDGEVHGFFNASLNANVSSASDVDWNASALLPQLVLSNASPLLKEFGDLRPFPLEQVLWSVFSASLILFVLKENTVCSMYVIWSP